MSSHKQLTIVIPTYNRAVKLTRFLKYLLKINTDKKLVLDTVRFLIADGSQAIDQKNHEIVKCLIKLGLSIQYKHFPNVGLQQRFIEISSKIDTDYILLCGDDDLIDFEGIDEWLRRKNSLPFDHVYAGRFSNIIGLSIYGLEMDCLERPYYGFEIASEWIETRVIMYGLANAFGVSSLSYAIQPTYLFQEFWIMTDGKSFYYGGLEFLHQIFLTARSKIIFSEKTLIFRDFSYIGYKHDKLREAPDTDKYPYLGAESVNMAIQILSKYSKIDISKANDIILRIIEIQAHITKSKKRLQHSCKKHGHRICSNSDSATLTAVKLAWFKTYLSAYPKSIAIKVFILLSMPKLIQDILLKIRYFWNK